MWDFDLILMCVFNVYPGHCNMDVLTNLQLFLIMYRPNMYSPVIDKNIKD